MSKRVFEWVVDPEDGQDYLLDDNLPIDFCDTLNGELT